MASHMYSGTLIVTWIILSTALIFQNKHILTRAPYPLTLTAGHVVFAWLASALLKRYAPTLYYRGSSRNAHPPCLPDHDKSHIPETPDTSLDMDTTASFEDEKQILSDESTVSLQDKLEVERNLSPQPVTDSTSDQLTSTQTDSQVFWTRLVPAGVLFAASLGLSNAVYLYLSVTTIQIIKSGSPIAVMTTAFLFGLKQPSVNLVAIILLISAGAGIASFGAADFSAVGVTLQIFAILVEATRLCLTQTLLHGCGFGPLQSIKATSPICIASLLILIVPLEGLAGWQNILALGPPTLISNLVLSFALNVSSVFLIDLSSLVMSLSKVTKDILLIAGGTVLLGEHLSALQGIGYSIALCGLGLYKYFG